jgi:hypothetical protein
MSTHPVTSERPEAPLFSDGLGDRVVAVDGASRDLLQILRLHPAVTSVPSFEFALRERTARLANFRHAYFARVRRIDRIQVPGPGLAIVSDHVEGTRLSDILRVAWERRLQLDINTALCLIRQLVPAVALLHENARDVAHGLIGPERILVTPHARLVIVEHVLGAAVEQLHYSRERLWQDFRVAVPPSAGMPRFDHRADVTGIGIVALSLLLGRPLTAGEFPQQLPALLAAARERTALGEEQPLSAPLRDWLSRALHLDPRRAFTGAPEALAVLEDTLADESEYVAAPVALETFLSSYISALLEPPPDAPDAMAPAAAAMPPSPPGSAEPLTGAEVAAPEVGSSPAGSFTTPAVTRLPEVPAPAQGPVLAMPAIAAPVAPDPVPSAAVTPVNSEPAVSTASTAAFATPGSPREKAPAVASSARFVTAVPPGADLDDEAAARAAIYTKVPRRGDPVSRAADSQEPAPERPVGVEPMRPADAAEPALPTTAVSAVPVKDDRADAPADVPLADVPDLTQLIPAEDLVDRPAAPHPFFDDVEPVEQRPASRPGGPSRLKRKPLAAAAAVLALLAAGAWFAAGPSAAGGTAGALGTVDVKSNPSGVQVFLDGVARGQTPAVFSVEPGAHILELRGHGVPRVIPITVAAGAQVSQYLELPDRPMVGQLEVQSEPAGAAVTVDGKEWGTTPATVTGLQPGEHEVVLKAAVGMVRQTVTIQPGVVASLVVPIGAETPAGPVSGWLSVKAPVRVEISEDGRLLGTSESERVMLASGRHTLDLTNETLGYKERRTVQIAPGKTAALSIEFPDGVVNLNASPWAEVFIDGQRVGETPIGNLKVPIGPHEIVFRHPQFGEKKHAVSVTLAGPVRLSVDMK